MVMHLIAAEALDTNNVHTWLYIIASALGAASIIVGFFIAGARYLVSRGSKDATLVEEHHKTQEAMYTMTHSLEAVKEATLTLAAEFRGYRDFANDRFDEQRRRLNRHEILIADGIDRLDDLDGALEFYHPEPAGRRADRRLKRDKLAKDERMDEQDVRMAKAESRGRARDQRMDRQDAEMGFVDSDITEFDETENGDDTSNG